MPSILIIDDQPLIRLFMRSVLETAGYEVREAAGGVDGVRLYQEHPADLVICDVFMENLDGVATMLLLRRANPDVRIVAISGAIMAVRVEALCDERLCGVAASLKKPFAVTELLEVVRRVLVFQNA